MGPNLTEDLAARFARLALNCVTREYPNKIAHTMQSDADALPPRVLTPAFYGCYDWHSAVHGHWLLARLSRLFPDAAFAAEARAALARNITEENIAAELRYFNDEGRAAFERPYGLAWLLTLASELQSEVLRPLEKAVLERFSTWLEKLSVPGAVGRAQQYRVRSRPGARLPPLRVVRTPRPRFLFGRPQCPDRLRAIGRRFSVAGVGRGRCDAPRAYPPPHFREWFAEFLPDLSHLRPVVSPDPSDPKFSHLDGLNLSRAWMLRGDRRT